MSGKYGKLISKVFYAKNQDAIFACDVMKDFIMHVKLVDEEQPDVEFVEFNHKMYLLDLDRCDYDSSVYFLGCCPYGTNDLRKLFDIVVKKNLTVNIIDNSLNKYDLETHYYNKFNSYTSSITVYHGDCSITKLTYDKLIEISTMLNPIYRIKTKVHPRIIELLDSCFCSYFYQDFIPDMDSTYYGIVRDRILNSSIFHYWYDKKGKNYKPIFDISTNQMLEYQELESKFINEVTRDGKPCADIMKFFKKVLFENSYSAGIKIQDTLYTAKVVTTLFELLDPFVIDSNGSDKYNIYTWTDKFNKFITIIVSTFGKSKIVSNRCYEIATILGKKFDAEYITGTNDKAIIYSNKPIFSEPNQIIYIDNGILSNKLRVTKIA